MLRSGAWAVPLPCDAPVLVAWTRFTDRVHAAVCALPGITCATPATAADLCREWTPLAIGTSVLAVLVVLACAVISALRPLRWCALVHCSALLTAVFICSAAWQRKEAAWAAGGVQLLARLEGTCLPEPTVACARRWRIGHRRSANVAEAAAQLAELRRGRPDQYPQTAHEWAPLPPREELAPPLLCAVCFRRTRLGSDLKVRL